MKILTFKGGRDFLFKWPLAKIETFRGGWDFFGPLHGTSDSEGHFGAKKVDDGQHRTSLLHTVVVTSSWEKWRKEVRPGVVRRPWRAAWGRPPAVESGLGPSAGRRERPGSVRRPRRATWGRPLAVESDLGPSAGRGERPGAVRRPRRAAWGLEWLAARRKKLWDTWGQILSPWLEDKVDSGTGLMSTVV